MCVRFSGVYGKETRVSATLGAGDACLFLCLGRYEHNRTGRPTADLPRGPTEDHIEDASFAVAPDDQQVGRDTVSYLHNDLPRIAHPQEALHHNPVFLEREDVVVHSSLHQAVSGV